MPQITDETIKRRHKEFDKRIKAILEEVRGENKPRISMMDTFKRFITRK